jgi:hypothetical protein
VEDLQRHIRSLEHELLHVKENPVIKEVEVLPEKQKSEEG